MHMKRLHLTRAALAIGAITGASLIGASSAFADETPMLAGPMRPMLAAGQSAAFNFAYGGTGEVAHIVVVPSKGGADSLAFQVIGPDGKAVEVFGADSIGIKEADVVNGPAGLYTVHVMNNDANSAVEFTIDAQQSALAPRDNTPNDNGGSTPDSTGVNAPMDFST